MATPSKTDEMDASASASASASAMPSLPPKAPSVTSSKMSKEEEIKVLQDKLNEIWKEGPTEENLDEIVKISVQKKAIKKAIETKNKEYLIKTEKELRELGIMDPKSAYEAQFIDFAGIYSKYYDDGVWNESAISDSLFSEKNTDDIALHFLRNKLGSGSSLRADIEGTTATTQCRKMGIDLSPHGESKCWLCECKLSEVDSYTPECEHVLPCLRGVMFLCLWNSNFMRSYGSGKLWKSLEDHRKLEYKPSHKTCNIAKSDIIPLKLHENRFVIDDNKLNSLVIKIKLSVKKNSGNDICHDNIVLKYREVYEAALKLINEEFEKFGFKTGVYLNYCYLKIQNYGKSSEHYKILAAIREAKESQIIDQSSNIIKLENHLRKSIVEKVENEELENALRMEYIKESEQFLKSSMSKEKVIDDDSVLRGHYLTMPDFTEKEVTFEENKDKMFKDKNPYLFGVNSKFDYLSKYAEMYIEHLFNKRTKAYPGPYNSYSKDMIHISPMTAKKASEKLQELTITEYGKGKVLETYINDLGMEMFKIEVTFEATSIGPAELSGNIVEIISLPWNAMGQSIFSNSKSKRIFMDYFVAIIKVKIIDLLKMIDLFKKELDTDIEYSRVTYFYKYIQEILPNIINLYFFIFLDTLKDVCDGEITYLQFCDPRVDWLSEEKCRKAKLKDFFYKNNLIKRHVLERPYSGDWNSIRNYTSIKKEDSIKNELNIIFSKIEQYSINATLQILPSVGDSRDDNLKEQSFKMSNILVDSISNILTTNEEKKASEYNFYNIKQTKTLFGLELFRFNIPKNVTDETKEILDITRPYIENNELVLKTFGKAALKKERDKRDERIKSEPIIGDGMGEGEGYIDPSLKELRKEDDESLLRISREEKRAIEELVENLQKKEKYSSINEEKLKEYVIKVSEKEDYVDEDSMEGQVKGIELSNEKFEKELDKLIFPPPPAPTRPILKVDSKKPFTIKKDSASGDEKSEGKEMDVAKNFPLGEKRVRQSTEEVSEERKNKKVNKEPETKKGGKKRKTRRGRKRKTKKTRRKKTRGGRKNTRNNKRKNTRRKYNKKRKTRRRL